MQIVYFMRGGIQYDDIMWRTPFERGIMEEFVMKRLEIESKSMHPVY